MTKKLFSFSLLALISFTTFFSCRKAPNTTVDYTVNYFPLVLGKSVTYEVDSTYYFGAPACTELQVQSQMKYVLTDTFTDNEGRVSYIMDVYTRPYQNANWTHLSAIFITPTPTPLLTTSDPATTSLLYTQDGTQYVKMIFPITNGYTWQGNQYANIADPLYSYLANWTYMYSNFHLSYNTGFINFDNTVTVQEDDATVNYPAIDSNVDAYRIYAKEVYAYNVGMVYKEWFHTTYAPYNTSCVSGYGLVMRAIDHN